jgi:hypothetical protein
MNIKPATQWLNKNSDVLLIGNVKIVLAAMTANAAIYPAPSPSLPVVQSALTDFAAAVTAMADAGPSMTAKKISLRRALVALMRQLAHYVAVACQGDLMNLLLSGFPSQKTDRTPVGILPAPQNTTVRHGALSGSLTGRVKSVAGAKLYNWTCTASLPGAVPLTGQSTGARCTFTGLTPGVSYKIAASATGTAGPGDWSSPASLIAI